MRLGHILVEGQRVADQHRVGFGGVQRAVGAVGDRVAVQRHPALQHEPLVETDVGVLDVGQGGEFVHGAVQIGRRVRQSQWLGMDAQRGGYVS